MTKDEIQAEALTAIGDKRKSGVEISMGVGKCVLGLKHMAKHYSDIASFMVVAPRVSIFESWINDAKNFGFEYLLPHITFSTYVSLSSHNPYNFDVVYLDECHSLKKKYAGWLSLFEIHGGKILGLTGTYPPTSKSEKGEMCERFCPKVYTYQTDDAVDAEILNDYRIYVHMLHLSSALTIPVETKSGSTFMTSELKNYNYWNERVEDASTPKEEQLTRIQRMKALQKMPSKLEYAKKLLHQQVDKTLVFANTKEQADYLCKDSIHSGVDKKKAKVILDAFKSGEIMKASAVDQLSEGVTIPNLKVEIIMHAYGNNRKASQKIGRCLRLSPDEVATIHILCYVNSVDKEWVESALSNFDQSKIKWIQPI
jgi:superfamily II DNA or RNA helicase